jgi:hypothetical protein
MCDIPSPETPDEILGTVVEKSYDGIRNDTTASATRKNKKALNLRPSPLVCTLVFTIDDFVMFAILFEGKPRLAKFELTFNTLRTHHADRTPIVFFCLAGIPLTAFHPIHACSSNWSSKTVENW